MITSFKKIDHINIVVKNLEEAKSFFSDLGFIVQHEGVLEGEWLDNVTGLKNVRATYISLRLESSETNIELLKFFHPECLTTRDNDVLNKNGFRHAAFEVEHIEEIVKKLKNQGIEFVSDIQIYKETKKRLCYLKGPEGIMLELVEYGR